MPSADSTLDTQCEVAKGLAGIEEHRLSLPSRSQCVRTVPVVLFELQPPEPPAERSFFSWVFSGFDNPWELHPGRALFCTV